MSQTTPAPAPSAPDAKKGALTGAALTDEVLDSSPTLLRGSRGGEEVVGLQQYFSPPELAELIAAVNDRQLSTLDLTAGDGSLLAGLDPDSRFGIEIDADHTRADRYTAIHGDVQSAYPLLRLLGARFPRVACNPPFGLDWQIAGRPENSTLAAWRMAGALLDERGAGVFVAGRDRFMREVMPRPDAAGVYALLECADLFEGVELPCVVAFFVAAGAVDSPREEGPLRLRLSRTDLPGRAEELRAERDRIAGWIVDAPRCPRRASLRDAFAHVPRELTRRRRDAEASRQSFDLALAGGRISARPGAFARLALQRRRVLREVERLNGQPPTYFALYADPCVMPTSVGLVAPGAGISPVRSA